MNEDMLLRDISIFWCLLHVAVIFTMLYRPKYERKKALFLIFLGIGVLIVANWAGLWMLGHNRMGKLFLLTCTFPSLIYFWLLSADKNGKFLRTFCLADTSCLWIMVVTNLLDTFFGGERYEVMLVSRLILMPALEYGVYRYFRGYYLKLQNEVEKGWGIFAGMTMLYYVLLAVVADFPTNISERPEDVPACILILLLMFFTYATMFTSLYGQFLLYQKKQSERSLSEQKRRLEQQLESQQQIRRIRHDMKGYAITLSGILAAGKVEEASAYLQKVASVVEPVFTQFCSNMYLNAVFAHYVHKFEELGVTLKLNIQVGEEELPDMELCQILSNGLENAWEASQKLPLAKREASVQMRYSREYLIIRIRNRCAEGLHVEKGTIPATEKTETGHGFGLITIREAAERLSGNMFCYTDAGQFVLDVMVKTA